MVWWVAAFVPQAVSRRDRDSEVRNSSISAPSQTRRHEGDFGFGAVIRGKTIDPVRILTYLILQALPIRENRSVASDER